MIEAVLGEQTALADVLRRNIEAGTGPTAPSTAVARELAPLLTHLRLGPLVRQLTLYAERPGLPAMSLSA
ncbi:MAG: hypothetical protein ABSB58_00750 [Gemmatimonadales bacterium]|jgi:hypothetical protein